MAGEHRQPASRSRRVGATVAAGVLTTAAIAAGAGLLGVTDAQRSSEQHVTTEFTANAFELEATADGTSWSDGDSADPIALNFSPDQMALQVGRTSAVYTPIQVRMKQGSLIGSEATTVSAHLEGADASSGFGQALRANAYVVDNPGACRLGGVSSDAELETISGTENVLRTLNVGSFELPGATQDAPGEATTVCLEMWMANNTWLIGRGTPQKNVSVGWTVTGQMSSSQGAQ